MVSKTLRTVTPRPGTPTAIFRGKRDKIDGIPVWLKGRSPTANDESLSPYRERAAYIVNKLLGLRIVPITVLRVIDGEVVSAQKWVRGECPRISRPPELDVFDYIIGNTDRHNGNWLVKPSGRVWAIDNAFSFYFTNAGDFYCIDGLSDNIKSKLQKALNNEREFHRRLDDLIGEEQVTAVLRRIEKVLEYIQET